MSYRSIKGMEDILPDNVASWQSIEEKARVELESSGYRQMRTPSLEETALFVRGIGETTDIVTKEMYTFEDRKGRSLSLRPEGTAPIVRAYIEHSLHTLSSESRIYYIGPMFRAERPQKGRSRQFHQVGVEVIGTYSPYDDAEVIVRLDRMLKSFGLDGFTIKINSLGCSKDKALYAERLKEYLKDEKQRLCEDCHARMGKNVLRVLDCKQEACRLVSRGAPSVSDSLCGECQSHYEKVKKALSGIGIKFTEEPRLVRGLDYYTGTVFEVTHSALGSQDAIGAGGRYNNLVKELGGPDVGAVGFAIGIERVIMALGDKLQNAAKSVIYVAALGDAAKIEGMKLAEELRISLKSSGAVILIDLKDSSLKSQMRNADKNGAKFVLMLGDDELRSGKIIVKDMAAKTQAEYHRANIVDEIRKRIC